MHVKSDIIENMHLDPGYALLSVQNVITCMELFRMMDIHHNTTLNDIQFWVFIRAYTDLTKYDADLLFHLLDVDHSGEMDFEEFYLIFCVLVASKDQYEKEFIYRHSKSIFRLIDSDASGLVSNDEFSQMGILFNFDTYSISSIFNEFDISGDKNLDFGEFRLFTMACIDEQRAVDAHTKVTAYNGYHQRLLVSLQDILKHYIKTKILPRPAAVEFAVDRVRSPYIPRTKRWKRWFDMEFFRSTLQLATYHMQRFKLKSIAQMKFLIGTFKKIFLSWKCYNVFYKKCCSCFIKSKDENERRIHVNPESHREYNRRRRELAKKNRLKAAKKHKKRKDRKKSQADTDEGQDYEEDLYYGSGNDDDKGLVGTEAGSGSKDKEPVNSEEVKMLFVKSNSGIIGEGSEQNLLPSPVSASQGSSPSLDLSPKPGLSPSPLAIPGPVRERRKSVWSVVDKND